MPRRLNVTDVNPHVVCTICDGYLVDATSIIECLHAFCRTCIVRYLENSKFCPVCDVQVHKTKPLLSIRSDQTLQDLVYKMVPDLYQNEMQRRREFYAEHPEAAAGRTPEERGEGEPRFFSPKELISLSLQHLKFKDSKSSEQPEGKDPMTRHLNCPAALTVGHMKKFINLKFSLPHTCGVDVFYDDHLLKDSLQLMDVAYMYSWKRAEPMKFFYSIVKRVPKCLEPPPPPTPPETVEQPAAETVHSNGCVANEVPEVLPATTSVVEQEPMEIDTESSKPEDEEVEKAPSEEAIVNTSELATTSSKHDVQVMDVTKHDVQVMDVTKHDVQMMDVTKHDVQVMDVTEHKIQSNSSLPLKLVPAPLVPEPTYNSVKLVSTPEPNTLLSPTNGFRLKFIHDPELNPKKSGSKKSGRKGGRSSRHKSAPVRLARLAPYPPPPVTCLATPSHISQLTVGKLVPSVIPTLAQTFVTTLVSTTSDTLCSNASSASTFIGQSPAVCTITTPHVLPPPVLPITADNAVALSSTANTVTVSASPLGSTTSPVQDSSEITKELSSAEAAASSRISVPSSAHTSTAVSVPADSDTPVLNNPSDSTVCDTSALTNSIVDSHPTKTYVADSSLSPSPKPTAVVSSSTKDVDGSEVVTSTSVDPLVPVSAAVPIPHMDPKKGETENAKLPAERACHSHNSTENRELKTPATSFYSSVSGDNVPPSVTVNGVLDKNMLSPKEIIMGKRSFECLSSNSVHESINNASTKESVVNKTSSESFSSINGHKEKTKLTPKDSTVVVEKNSSESCRSIHDSEGFKESVDSGKKSLEAMVRGTISAEFSDNDDLGCQSDLVVDEQKTVDSSDNEEEEDADLRKKINAIAEKEDETDDTEADSGRASDMSCPARCEDDVGSPMETDQAPAATTAAAPSHQHQSKSNNIDHVIKQLYLQHEIGRSPSSPKPATTTAQQQQQQQQPQPQPPQRDDMGALDLSTCTRKPGESSTQSARSRTVANPVLDIKHRQQTYLPAPVRQHTACVPAPKHPTSSPLLMHQLTTAAHSSILQAQLTGKSPHSLHHHSVPYSPYPLPTSNNRTVSSPSPMAGRPSPPSYSYRFPHQNAAALQQQGSSMNMLAGMMPYAASVMAGYAARAAVPQPPRPPSTTSSHRKDVTSPPASSNSKMSPSSTNFSSHFGRNLERKNWSPTGSRKLNETLVSGGPNCRGPSVLPASSTGVPTHPRASPSVMGMSPHHRSASPAPSPHSVANNSSSSFPMPPSTAVMTASTTSSSQSKPSVPIYKKSDSFKNKFKRSANLAVYNPDPNGFRQKLVIKNLDSRSNSNSNHHHHHHH